MASNVIRVSLLADASKMKAGLSDADRAVGTTEKKMEGFGKAAVASFGVIAAGAVIGFATDAVKSFSEVEQSAGSVEAVFGDSAKAITDQAEGAAEAFGLSASQFQTSAALIGSMLKNQMGLSAEEAAERVDDLTGKASDMAATFGGTTSDAISAIGSLLRGERDPIEKYGVSMNDAAIKARALELGLEDATGAIGPAAKATAALDILNEQTADSTGQFAKESDTLAGSQQILAAEFENAKAKLGEQLAPAVTDTIGLFTDLITKMAEAEEGWQNFGKDIDDVRAKLGFTGLTVLEQVDAWEQQNKAVSVGTGLMREARISGVQPLTDAEKDLTGAIRDTITVRQEANDQMRASIDPFFALVDATDAQKEAQKKVNTLVRKGADEDNPALIDALRTLADTSLDVEEAQLDLLAAGGLTREEFEKQRVKMGLTAAEAQILIDKYDLIFTPRTVEHTIRYHELTESDSTGRTYRGGRQAGGPVIKGTPYLVGEAGPEIVVPASNGTVVPNSRLSGGHSPVGGTSINITIHAGMGSDPNAISKAIVEALQRYQRANGHVPIRTR